MESRKPVIILAATLFAGLVPSLVTAQNGPPPVTVTGTVQVQGAVQTTNDVVYLPYVKSDLSSIAAGGPADAARVSFDVPDGKRLVVETIIFQSIGGFRNFIEIRQGNGSVNAPLSAQYVSPDGYQMAVHPFKVRIDAVPGNTAELSIRTGVAAPPVSLWVGVYGYLVDL